MPADPTVDSQVVLLKAAGVDLLINMAAPKFTAQLIRKAAELNWRPVHLLGVSTSSIDAALVPAGLNNGNLWLAVHLDYGLKGTTGYGKVTGGNAIPCGSGTRSITNNQSYSFDGAGVKTCNTFKNVTGVFGFVVNGVTTYEIPGVPAVLKDSSGKSLATGTSDQDGFYVLNYKSSKDTTVSVTITPSGYKAQTKSMTLKANAIAEVDFTCP